MRFVSITLDGRYTGNNWFKYRIEFMTNRYGHDARKDRAQQHQEMLEWLWENYGPGCDRDYWKFIAYDNYFPGAFPDKNGPRWAWYYDVKEHTPYIYIVDDTVLSHIQLKWIT